MAAQRCIVQTRVLFLSLSGSVRGNLKAYREGLPVMLERMVRLVCSGGCTKNAISAFKLADVLVHLFMVGPAWHTIGISCTVILAFLNLIIITKPPIILPSLN